MIEPCGADESTPRRMQGKPDPLGETRASHWYRVGPSFAGCRLDVFLQRMIPKLSRTRIRKAIATRVRLSWEAPVKPATTVRVGEIVFADDPAFDEPETDVAIPVLAETGDLLAVDKPAGLVVHPTHGHNRNTVITLLRRRRGEPELTLSHRLDAETSGVLLLGRHRWAARKLQLAFERGRVEKRYVAIVHGRLPRERLLLDAPLGPHTRDQFVFRQSSRSERSRPARTEVTLLASLGALSVVAVRLITGRRHQIRAHLAEAGHPIVGDKLYILDDLRYRDFLRSGLLSAAERDEIGADRVLLHSASLRLPDPREPSSSITVEAALPDDMIRWIANAGGAARGSSAWDGLDAALTGAGCGAYL